MDETTDLFFDHFERDHDELYEPDVIDEEEYYRDGDECFQDDVEADAAVLASAGWGTDEDYGCYGDGEW